jgi:hypothetical protein
VFALDLTTGAAEPWGMLGAQADRAGLNVTTRIKISRDGGTYAYTISRRLSTLYVVDGLR